MTTTAKTCSHWLIFAVLYVLGFIATCYFLSDADITMAVAHQQWEIHEEVALQLALTIWVPILIVFLLVHFCFRLHRRSRPPA